MAARILTTLILSEVYRGVWGAILIATYVSPIAIHSLGLGRWPLILSILLAVSITYLGVRRFRGEPILLLSLPITRYELLRSEATAILLTLLPLVLVSHILWAWNLLGGLLAATSLSMLATTYIYMGRGLRAKVTSIIILSLLVEGGLLTLPLELPGYILPSHVLLGLVHPYPDEPVVLLTLIIYGVAFYLLSTRLAGLKDYL